MQKNVASQKAIFFAFDSTTNLPKTGDAGNITPYESLDYGSVTAITDTSMTEMDSTNAKGYYICDLTQGETDANTILFSAKSNTSNIIVVGAPAVVQTVPASFVVAPGSSGAILIGGSNAATTIAGLTTGALSCTTITASGAVAFQSTFAVTSTTTLTGNVSLGGTLGVTGTTTFEAINTGTITTTGNWAVSGTATVTGGIVANITGNLSGSVGSLTTNNDKTGYALSATGSAALTEGYRANGATGTLPQLLYEIVAHLGESSIVTTTKTIHKIDHTTPAETFTLDSATTPTSITRAS